MVKVLTVAPGCIKNSMGKKVLSLIFAVLLSTSLWAQTQDWIDFNQDYARVKIGEKGWYRIRYEDILGIYPNARAIDPATLKVYWHGKEQARYVQAHTIFQAGDYVEFYGQPEDGSLDSGLYALTPCAVSNPYLSLFSDTAIYFLTWGGSVSSQQIQNQAALSVNTPAPDRYTARVIRSYPEQYYDGEIQADYASLSEYTEGEGWMSKTVQKGQMRDFVLPTTSIAGGTATLQTAIMGRSDALSTDGRNHHIRLSISGDGNNFSILKDSIFTGYAFIRFKLSVPAALLGNNNTTIRLQVIDDLGAAADQVALAYLHVDYPRYLEQMNRAESFAIDADANTVLTLKNTAAVQPFLYDIKGLKRIKGTINGNNCAFHLGSGGKKEVLFMDSALFKVESLEKVDFTQINNLINYNYIIITPKILKIGAEKYAQYQQEKGRAVLLLYTEELYQTFSYGLAHPIAIRHALDYLLKTQSNPPDFLFLMGKGLETSYARLPNKPSAVFVPGIGVPSSDQLFSSGLKGTTWEPAIATGRIAVRSNQEILDYLDKVKAYEQAPNEIERKSILHLSGGRSIQENEQFAASLAQQAEIARDTSLGARIITYAKKVNAPTTSDLKQKIQQAVNSGLGMISYFGHGSPVILEINIGDPAEYANTDRYPFFLLNGCDGSNPNIDTSMGEAFIRAPKKGFIAWLGTSAAGYSGQLTRFSKLFHQQAFQKNYGASIGYLLQQTVKDYQEEGNFLNRAHSRQYLLQGDPSLSFYHPKEADYEIADSLVFTQPKTVSTTSDSFTVAIVVKNLGKALHDSLSIRIERKFPDNQSISYPKIYTAPVFNRDTIYCTLPTHGLKAKGSNTLNIQIQSKNKHPESNSLNNTALYSFICSSNGINLLFPRPYGILSNDSIRFCIQAEDLFLKNKDYELEIDSLPTFTSSWKKTQLISRKNALVRLDLKLSLQAGKNYYWRAKLSGARDWQESTFSYLPTSSEGWRQQSRETGASAFLENMVYDSLLQAFHFSDNSLQISIRTKGDQAAAMINRELRLNNSLPVYANRNFSGMCLLALDPVSFERYSYPSAFNALANTPDYPAEEHVYSGVYFFNTAQAADQDSLIAYLNSIPNGHILMAYTGIQSHLQNFKNSTYQAFEACGAAKIRQVKEGHPYLLISKKGQTALAEKLADTLSSVPGTEQVLYIEQNLSGKWNRGSIRSAYIGPASEWGKVDYAFATSGSDKLNMAVYGLGPSGKDTLLMSNVATGSLLKDQIPANIHYIRLKADLSDTVNRTPAQLIFWQLGYAPTAESSIEIDSNYAFHAQNIQEGDSIAIRFLYRNLSKTITDSLVSSISVQENGKEQVIYQHKTAPLAAEKATLFSAKVPSKGFRGLYQLKAGLQPLQAHKDIYALNNSFSLPIRIEKDQHQPVLEVSIDGKRILDGEIVSPKPLITILSKDDNPYLKLNDTNLVKIFLKAEKEANYTPIYYSQAGMSVSAKKGGSSSFQVNYQPSTALKDGKYVLKIQAKDASGNQAAKDFLLSFEVVNESSISHFYPYPNPCTSAMRFVYTLTGQQIPDQLLIRIYTISGKVVREIRAAEFGPMRIGTNTSAFTWDGKDQFGDRLANGVYFYSVQVKALGQELKHRETASDALFEKGWGKIYLMR